MEAKTTFAIFFWELKIQDPSIGLSSETVVAFNALKVAVQYYRQPSARLQRVEARYEPNSPPRRLRGNTLARLSSETVSANCDVGCQTLSK